MLGCPGIYAILLVIFHIALFDLRTAACKLSTDVGGPTYFLISFTSSRVRGDGERGNIPVAPFLSTSSTPLLLSGISTGSSRAINKRTSRSSRIAYRCDVCTSRPTIQVFFSRRTCSDSSIPRSVYAWLSGTSAKIPGAMHVIKLRGDYTPEINDAGPLGHKTGTSK